jgi:hypothetical protein
VYHVLSIELKFKVLLAAMIMVCYGVFLFSTIASLSYGQLFQPGTQQELSPKSTSSPKAQQLKMPSPPGSVSPNLHAVRITSPTRGQQIPIGKDLTVTGISLANSTSHCHVSVMVDGVKPYQRATPTGSHSGAAAAAVADYSKWKFVLTSKYTTLKQGPNNKIVAKYSCVDKPDVASFYSINVIGTTTSIVTAAKL